MSDEVPLRTSEIPLNPMNQQQQQEENKFGFGEPEERRVYDLNDFEEEIDIQEAQHYDKSYWKAFKRAAPNDVGAEFEKIKKGEAPGAGYYEDFDDEEEDATNFTKMPTSVSELQDLQKGISLLLFGNRTDKFLDGINRLMRNLQNFIVVMGEYTFPALILHLVYVPLFLTVMLLNCLRESILWWVVTLILMGVCLAVIGAFSALLFVGYRGYRIYTARFDDDGKPRKREEQPAEDPYHDVFGDDEDSEEEKKEEEKKDAQPQPERG